MNTTVRPSETDALGDVSSLATAIIRVAATDINTGANLFFVDRRAADEVVTLFDAMMVIEMARQVYNSQEIDDETAVSLSAKLIQARPALVRHLRLLGNDALAKTLASSQSASASGNFSHISLVSVEGQEYRSNQVSDSLVSDIRVRITSDITGRSFPLPLIKTLLDITDVRIVHTLQTRYGVAHDVAQSIATASIESVLIELAAAMRMQIIDSTEVSEFVGAAIDGVSPQFILRTLCRGEITLAEAMLADLSGLPQDDIAFACERCGITGIEEVFRQAAIAPAFASVFAAVFEYASDLMEPENCRERDEFMQEAIAIATGACVDPATDSRIAEAIVSLSDDQPFFHNSIVSSLMADDHAVIQMPTAMAMAMAN